MPPRTVRWQPITSVLAERDRCATGVLATKAITAAVASFATGLNHRLTLVRRPIRRTRICRSLPRTGTDLVTTCHSPPCFPTDPTKLDHRKSSKRSPRRRTTPSAVARTSYRQGRRMPRMSSAPSCQSAIAASCHARRGCVRWRRVPPRSADRVRLEDPNDQGENAHGNQQPRYRSHQVKESRLGPQVSGQRQNTPHRHDRARRDLRPLCAAHALEHMTSSHRPELPD